MAAADASGARNRTPRTLVVLGLAVVGVAVARLGDDLLRTDLLSWGFAAPLSLAVGVGCIAQVVKALTSRNGHQLTVRKTVIFVYVALFSLGLFALLELQHMKRLHYPLARYLPLPDGPMVMRALLMAIAGGILLELGGFALSRLKPRRTRDVSPRGVVDVSEHAEIRFLRAATVLLVVGLVACLAVVGVTREIPLFAANIDVVRYTQGADLGFVSLLEYELLAAAILAGSVAVCGSQLRLRAVLIALAAIASLLVFRVERTPILVCAIALALMTATTERRVSRRFILVGVGMLFVMTIGIGLFRFVSAVGPAGADAERARAMLDVGPEFREQSFVYSVYPSRAPHLGVTGVVADVSALVPGRLLALGGLDKQAVYTDASREYSATMRRLGYYQTLAPIRVGIAAEFWMDFGWFGFVLGMMLFGAVVRQVSDMPVRTPEDAVVLAASGAFLVSALVTPLASVMPVALMAIGPLWIMRRGHGQPLDRVAQAAVADS